MKHNSYPKATNERGALYYVFRDVYEDLVCLVRTDYIIPYSNVVNIVYEVLDVQYDPEDKVVHAKNSGWNIPMWLTWAAFEVCPVIEITHVREYRNVHGILTHEWAWHRIKP